MKRIGLLLLCIVLLIGCTKEDEVIIEETEEIVEDICTLEEDGVCYEEDAFLIEKDAEIKIGNLPVNLQQAIIDLWDTTYPNHKGLITLSEEGELEESQVIGSLLYKDDIDIIYAEETMLTYYIDHLYELRDELGLPKTMEYQIPIENYFMPYTLDGIAFLYNKTMLESLGVNMEVDSNEDGLPDSIDDFDKIFTLASRYSYDIPTYKGKELLTYFPLCFNEQTISYFMISAGFRLFPTLEGDKPGFDTEEFKTALEFIYNAGKFPLAVKKNDVTASGKREIVYTPYDADDYVWQLESVYTSETAPFGLVTTFMDIDTPMAFHGSALVINKFPTYRGVEITPLVDYQGFAIEDDTNEPSAAHAVMKFLKSKEVMQLFVDNSDKLLYLHDNAELDFREDINRKNYTKSLMDATHIPLLGLPDNMYQEAIEYYYKGDYMSILKDLFNHDITVNQAQKLFIESYKAWYQEKVTASSLNDELSK